MQDKFAMFDIAGDLTAAAFGNGAAGSYVSSESYDTAAAGVPNAVGPIGTIGGPLMHDLGRGLRLKFYAQIVTAVTSAGSATLEVDFVCADDAALATNLTTLLQSPAIAKATLLKGYRFRHGSTPGVVPREFVGAQYVIATATLTAGKITTGLMLDEDDNADVLG